MNDSTDYLDTPFTHTAIERDLLTALDERDAMIAHYQAREARRATTRRALRDFCGLLLGLAVFAAIVWLGVVR